MKSAFRISSLLFINFALVLLLSCCRKNAPQKSPAGVELARPALTSLLLPRSNTVIKHGDSVKIEISLQNRDIHIDSVLVFNGKEEQLAVPGMPGNIYWSSGKSRVGQTTLRIMACYNDSLMDSHNVSLVILSDVAPKRYKYRVIKKYPHDDQAYTQGLIYDKGLLYESTGLQGKSSLRIVDIPSGNPLKMVSLEEDFFGEGISFFKDQVYQVTYKSQVGFIYDKQTLNLIRSFDYQIREGWGLTADEKQLIMSDGSAQLYFIEPEFFTQTDKIEVFDSKGMIDSLNELEYVHGTVLANVYGQSYIVMIDPRTGKVTGTVELQDLMPEGSKGDYGKVLNGIAYNPQTGHFYVTGKNWPVLYEIELIPSLSGIN